MEHIKIEQNGTEAVSLELISKLYTHALASDINSNLKGILITDKCYKDERDYLINRFQDLSIQYNDYCIKFADPEVSHICISQFGDGQYVTATQLAAVQSLGENFAQNTDIQTFNELSLFTAITTLGNNGHMYYKHYGDFRGCTSLTSIDLTNVKVIDSNTFDGCTNLVNLGNFKPREFTHDFCFIDCSSLKSIDLSECTTVSFRCFDRCTSLESVNSLTNITFLDVLCFGNCSSLNIDLNVPALTTLKQGAFYKSGIRSVTSLGSSITELVDGSYKEGYYNVGMFAQCPNLTSVVLPSSCVKLGKYSFDTCTNLISINTDNVTDIANYCFLKCSSLTTVNLSSATHIGYEAFRESGLTGNISLPSITSIEDNAFLDTNVTSVDFTGSSITTIPNQCFFHCSNLTSVTVPSTITVVGRQAFEGSGLTSFDFSNITEIYNSSFAGCGLSGAIQLPSISTMGTYCFSNTGITSVDFTGSTLTTWSRCLNDMSYLDNITLPNTLTTIDNSLNFDMQSLRWVKCPCITPPTVSLPNGCFTNCNAYFYVPDSSLSSYQSASGWSNISNHIFPMSQFSTDFPND